MTIVGGHKVLDLARLCDLEMAAADEVLGQIVLGSSGARGAVGRAIGARLLWPGHGVGWESHAGGWCRGLGSGMRVGKILREGEGEGE